MNYFSKYKWWQAALVVLFIANIATLVLVWLAKTPPGNGPLQQRIRPQNATAFLVKELDFSSSQADAYKELFKQHQREVNVIRDSIRMSKDEFFELIAEDDATDQQLQERAARSARLQQQLDVLTLKHFQKVKKLCNASQQQKFDEVIQKVVRRMAPPLRSVEMGRPPDHPFNRQPPGDHPPGPPPNEPPPTQ